MDTSLAQILAMNNGQASSISVLNDDILMRIFDYLHLDDKIRLGRTCKRWQILLEAQLNQVKALRVGEFHLGGYSVTSGLQMQCIHTISSKYNHRQQTGTLSNELVLSLPADPATQCYSINQYDYLYRAMRHCYQNITMLSLGRLNVSYRLLMVIAHNLPKLEHLELIGCASELEQNSKKKQQPTYSRDNIYSQQHLNTITRETTAAQSFDHSYSERSRNNLNHLPSIETFNCQQSASVVELYSKLLYNQHDDEQLNLEERLSRAQLVKNCELVKESKRHNYWPNLTHLLVKECNLLNEFSLSLILAITGQTLENLVVESNQYLTGEFLNYCGLQLRILRLKYCPLLQMKFLEDLVKLRKLLSPSSSPSSSPLPQQQQSLPSLSFPFINLYKQDIYCML